MTEAHDARGEASDILAAPLPARKQELKKTVAVPLIAPRIAKLGQPEGIAKRHQVTSRATVQKLITALRAFGATTRLANACQSVV